MVRILVLYRSKTGFTKRYAEGISKEIDSRLMELKELKAKDLDEYDLVIYGGGLYAGVISGYKRFKRMLDKSKCKRHILFSVGATPKDDFSTIEKMWRGNIKEDDLKKIPHFYMQGGVDYDKLGFFKKSLLKAVANEIYRKNPKHDLRKSFDNVTIGALEPILRYLKGKK